MNTRASAAIGRVADIESAESIERAVREAVGLACDFAAVCRGRGVVLKPNVYCPSAPPTTTDPRVIAALIHLANDCGAREVTVAEGRSISTALFRRGRQTTRACFESTGMDSAAAENGARIVYLEEDEFVTVANPGAEVLREVSIARTVYEAEALVNVPAMKIHSLTLTTLGIKNLHGVVSDTNKLFAHDYNRIPHKLVDILRCRKPDLTVIDGVRGQEADHAELGTPIDAGVVIASADTVAADAVAEAVMCLDNLESDTTRIAHEQGLGVGDINEIEVVGARVEDVRKPFSRPDVEISEVRFPGIRIAAGEYCRGCGYYVRRGIDRLVESGVLDPNDKLTLVFGKDPQVEPDVDGRVVLIGDCALESPSVKRLRDHLWLTGRLRIIYCCPPMEFRMRALELAGD